MNAAEHIVESYFRLCLGCFTLADKKVSKGNGRQLDLLAVNIAEKKCFHIEVGVTHQENWCPTLAKLEGEFERKFFGAPPERRGKTNGTTDFEKGKFYFPQIQGAYEEVGFEPSQVSRVWVCWVVKNADNSVPIEVSYEVPRLGLTFPIRVLSLRDFVLPKLQAKIGTSNYDDEVLRLLSLLEQKESQRVNRTGRGSQARSNVQAAGRRVPNSTESGGEAAPYAPH